MKGETQRERQRSPTLAYIVSYVLSSHVCQIILGVTPPPSLSLPQPPSQTQNVLEKTQTKNKQKTTNIIIR